MNELDHKSVEEFLDELRKAENPIKKYDKYRLKIGFVDKGVWHRISLRYCGLGQDVIDELGKLGEEQ